MLSSDSDHAAVFRRNDLWSPSRLAVLQLFVTRAQAAKARDTICAVCRKFLENRTEYEDNLQADLIRYFEGGYAA